VDVVEIKGEMTLLNVLQVASTDLEDIRQALRRKRDSLPQVFANSPLAVDCTLLAGECDKLDMQGLRDVVLALGFVPVGMRNLPDECVAQAVQAGWGILRAARHGAASRNERSSGRDTPCAGKRTEVIERPVRSGQQVYFPDGDIVVLQHTSAGSELLAGGSVHVYGSLRGRVLAGIQGDTSARIFCQKLEAELVAIAGNYRLLDEMDTNLRGQPAMVWLEGEKLRIAPMM
jgi:septum site-determining protein MinC